MKMIYRDIWEFNNMINLKENLNVRKVDDIERFNVNLKVTALEFEKIHKRILDLTRKHEITLEEFLLIYQDFDVVFRSFDAARTRLIRRLKE